MMTHSFRTCVAGLVFVSCTAIAAAQAPVTHPEVAAAPRFKAIALDYFVLFNPDSVVPEVEQVFAGKGREFTNLWRTRQFEYSWLRSISDRYVDFFAITEDQLGLDQLDLTRQDILFVAFGGWDAAGAKSFGYPTFWVNRFNQPVEELGIRPDQTSTNLDGLLHFVFGEPPVR